MKQFSFLLIFFLSCSKEPRNPAFTDDDITYRIEVTADSLTGDTVFALYIPNGFSPNGDGINDAFGPVGVGFSSGNYSMKIFNRWDNIVFETNDIKKMWDGRIAKKMAKKDFYEYQLSLSDFLGNRHGYVGKVLIIN